MGKNETVKILKFYTDKCTGGLDCERAYFQVHFISDERREKSDIHVVRKGGKEQRKIILNEAKNMKYWK